MLKINVKIYGKVYTHDVKNNADAIELAAYAGFMQAMVSQPYSTTTGKGEWDMWERVIKILTDAANNFLINVPFYKEYNLEADHADTDK